MNTPRSKCRKRPLALVMLAMLTAYPLAGHCDEREDLEKLRATVLSLIDTLIKTGILPRDRADAMMRDAQRRADVQLAKAPPPEVGADGKKIVRVPYVPEAVRVQMRDQIKAEVMAEMRDQGGGSGGAGTAANGSRLQFDGDVRMRAESLRFASDNTLASKYSFGNPDVTRAADIWVLPSFNTEQPQNRTRIRARMGVTVAVADNVSAGIGLATGSTSNPTSTNQTMATGSGTTPGFFNKYGVVIDKAFVSAKPLPWLTMTGGRMRNPFQGTDLLWADDLNFEGFALSANLRTSEQTESFVTAGWFPLSLTAPGQTRRRDLMAVQAGTSWQFGLKDNRLKFAAAMYGFNRIEGIKETTTDKNSVSDYVVRSEYGSGIRQRGNTLFRINTNPVYDSATNWGLASGFRELDLTASLDIAQFDPFHIVVTGDLVHNLAFSRDSIRSRTGFNLADGSGTGFLARIQVGATQIKQAGDWNVTLGYRRLGSDAVVDAFTSSDFGLGGTNNKGFTLGGNYGLAKNTWLSGRWMSSEVIDSMVPAGGTSTTRTKFSIDTIQVDLNTRF